MDVDGPFLKLKGTYFCQKNHLKKERIKMPRDFRVTHEGGITYKAAVTSESRDERCSQLSDPLRNMVTNWCRDHGGDRSDIGDVWCDEAPPWLPFATHYAYLRFNCVPNKKYFGEGWDYVEDEEMRARFE